MVLMSVLAQDCKNTKPDRLVSHILVDSRHGLYHGSLDALKKLAESMGICVLDVPIVSPDMARHDAAVTADWLMRLASIEQDASRGQHA